MIGLFNGLRKRTNDWMSDNKYRHRARRRTKQLIVVWVLVYVLTQLCGRFGLTSKLLSPSGGFAGVMLVALAASLVIMRLLLVLIAPSMLAFVWVRAIWPLPVLQRTDASH
jgi:hypothetical protein